MINLETLTESGTKIRGAYTYNLLTLGQALEQSVDGDKKSFTLQYIDWKNINNNIFHVSEEYSVMRRFSQCIVMK
jgi:type I site-specific restriction-modification system R (restriction) subunit